jgi:hypothetical protein
MTSSAGGAGDEGGGATDEGRVTSGSDNDESLATLDGGGSIADIALVLVDSERLASDGGLIDLEESVFGDNAAVGGDDGTLLDLEDVTRDDFGSLDFSEGAVTEDGGLESKRLLQLLDDRTSLEFLNETNTGVEQEQTANDTKIDPILKTSSENGSGLHDELNRTNEVHEELEDEVLLLLCAVVSNCLLKIIGCWKALTLHLVEAVLLPSGSDLAGSETSAGICLEKLLGNDTGVTRLGNLLVFVVDGGVLGLELLDQSIHVLLFLVIVFSVTLLGGQGFRALAIVLLLVLARLLLAQLRRSPEAPMAGLTSCPLGTLVPRWLGGTAPVFCGDCELPGLFGCLWAGNAAAAYLGHGD